jgi:hypothetical protein
MGVLAVRPVGQYLLPNVDAVEPAGVRFQDDRLTGRSSPVVHLICMRCNRANAGDAKFCGGCGAGLLRKFCGACNAVNDAESRFCQSCGHALPGHLASAPASKAPAKPVPDLTDEVLIGATLPHQPIAVAPLLDAGAFAPVPTHVPVLAIDTSTQREKAHKPAYRVPVLLAIGGAASLALAVWVWPRMEPSQVQMRRTVPVAAAAVEAVPVLAATPADATAAPSDAITRADAALAQANAAADAAAQPSARIKEAAEAETRRASIERGQPAQRRAADRALSQRALVQQEPAKPATPAPECTPQVYALGLCAPRATITGR